MEPLAFIEVLGRSNEVLVRHPVYRWPARVGRAYDADVILDDPFVAPRHLQIEPAADGRFAVSHLQSVNGVSLPPSRKRVASAEVGPDDFVRLGQTQIRVRAPSYAVRPELPLRSTAIYRRPWSFALMFAVLLGLVVWNGWVVAIHPEERGTLVFPTVVLVVAVTIWISIWALVSRTVGGRANFAAHGFVACAGLAALLSSEKLFEYLSFALGANWPGAIGTVAVAAVFAYMIYRHLRLNSRASNRRLGVAAVIASAVAYGAVAGLEYAGRAARQGLQQYDAILKAPVFLMVSGISPEAFLIEGERLKHAVDAVAREGPTR